VKPGCPTVITYADDFVVLCHSREEAEAVQTRIGAWLKERGLSLNKEKTRIGRIDAGFDFLSYVACTVMPRSVVGGWMGVCWWWRARHIRCGRVVRVV
jgi:hypothetical protein